MQSFPCGREPGNHGRGCAVYGFRARRFVRDPEGRTTAEKRGRFTAEAASRPKPDPHAEGSSASRDTGSDHNASKTREERGKFPAESFLFEPCESKKNSASRGSRLAEEVTCSRGESTGQTSKSSSSFRATWMVHPVMARSCVARGRSPRPRPGP